MKADTNIVACIQARMSSLCSYCYMCENFRSNDNSPIEAVDTELLQDRTEYVASDD